MYVHVHMEHSSYLISANDVLNLNLTQVFMEQYSQTQSKWTEEYFKESSPSEKISKHRTPFVPFAIRNNTGCNLAFATLTTSPRRISLSVTPDSDSHRDIGEWRQVRAGDQLPFLIEERDKIRHKVRGMNSHGKVRGARSRSI